MCYCTECDVDVASLIPDPPASASNPLVLFGSRDLQRRGSPRDNAKLFLAGIDESGLSRPDLIISGGADGADAAAEALSLMLGVPAVIMTVGGPSDDTRHRQAMADERDIPWVVHQTTDWGGSYGPAKYGAPLVRNCAMAELVATIDGGGFGIHVDDSRGTARMFTSLEDHGVNKWVRWPISL